MAVQVDDLDRAGLSLAVADLLTPQSGHVPPHGNAASSRAQRRLVALNGEQIVPAAGVQPGGVLPLGVQRIDGDQDIMQVGKAALNAAI